MRQIIAVASALLIGALSACAPKQEVPTARVTRQDVVQWVRLNGEAIVPPASRAEVLPPYRTTVAKVFSGVGQTVKEGDVLLELSAPAAQASYQQNREAVLAAESALQKADRQYSQAVQRAQSRLQEARKKEQQARQTAEKEVSAVGSNPESPEALTGAVRAGMNMEEAAAERKAAEQALIQAKAQREAALAPYKRQLEMAKAAFGGAQSARKAAAIRAPISGEVLVFNAQEKAMIGENAATPLVVIVDLDKVKVHAPMTAEQSAFVKEDLPATLAFPLIPNETFAGEVENIDTQPAQAGQQRIAVIPFKNEKGLVKPGMDANVGIKAGEAKNVLAVPTGAVDRDSTGRTVVNVLRNGNWEPVVVTVGLTGADFTEIRTGLEEGETVQITPDKA
ncbi:MAG: efflux RND transporter periplasmic adaptor subunit [Armatimonadetes bacterium]|nr:efflux RND transporter periplasmic adaptor subunit [Armatimonadota bacterium]